MTVSISASYNLYLSEEGDSIEISHFWNKIIIPEALEADSCKTHEHVLAFLNKIRNSDVKNKFIFCHKNNIRYEGHTDPDPDTFAHSCSLDKLISFVSQKILEKEHGIRKTIST
jgi:hypothetical protein